MPTRFIKESCRTSKNLQACSDFAERLFWRLLTTADDYGRFLACPSVVKASCFPLHEKLKSDTVNNALQELRSHHLLTLYQVGDREYGEFVTFSTHQGKPRAKESKYPEKPTACTSLHAPASICMQMHADVTGHPDTDTDLSSLSSSGSEFEARQSLRNDFETFWQAYPNKTGKDKAWEVWKSQKNTLRRPPLAMVLTVIARAKQSRKWMKDDGEYIPNPATWLNQGRWDDEPAMPPRKERLPL